MAYTTIDDPSAYFKCQLYVGDGSANHAITFDDTDTDMQPDMVWIKNRDATDSHCLFDSLRGATKVLTPNTTAAETTDTDTLDSFTSDGFQVDADVKVNTNTEKYVSWNWKAGTTGSGTTTGEGTGKAYSYTVSTAAGFSIVKYVGNGTTGHTIPHHLGVQPKILITKRITPSTYWAVWNVVDTAQDYMNFNDVISSSDGGVTIWNDTEPTSSVFSVGTHAYTNNNDLGYMAYLWTSIQGYSKFGSYEGNGNADGTFVYTGFRPAWVMIKSSDDNSSSWRLFDNKREGYNVDNDALVVDATTAEATTDHIDLLSNGFKCRKTDEVNAAETFIYLAFAEAPFVNSNGVPCNAR